MYRVLTFNLLCAGRKHRKWYKRAPLVYRVIREANPDSFGVQEAHWSWMKKLIKNLQGIENRKAHYTCAVVLCYPDGRSVTVEKYWNGSIGFEPIASAII